MKTVCKKLLCLMLVAMMLVSAVPFAFAAEGDYTFWYELWVDGVRVDNKDKTVQVTPGTEFSEDEIKAQAEEFWPSYFDGTYEFDKITESTKADADNNGVRVWLKTAEQDDDNQGGSDEGEQEDENDSVPSTPLNPSIPNGGQGGRPGQDNDNNNRPGQDNDNNNRPGQDNDNNNRPGQDNDNNNRPGNNFDKNQFPGNGHGKPNFNRETVELTVVYNFPDNYRYLGKTSETFTVWKGSDILDALEDAEDKGYYTVPTRDGYTLAGYSFDEDCKNDVNRDDEINKDLTVYCEWEESKVTLRVYTNGDTRYPDRTFSLDSYARDGKITHSEVEDLLDTKYSAKSGYTLAYYGLFTSKTWDDGDYDLDDAVSSITVNKKGETVIYVMVKNVKKAVADSSNPKTGDNIMIAVTTLALSAAALVSIVELKKRKMI